MREINAGVLVDRERTFLSMSRSDQLKAILTTLSGKGSLFVAWVETFAIRKKPDLVEVDALGGRRIEFAVGDAGTLAHSLKLAGSEDFAITHRISVFEGSLQHVRYDLHVVVGMGAKALAGSHEIFVHHPKGAKADVARVVVVGERKRMKGLEPAVVGVASFV